MNKSLEDTLFFEKKSHLVHRYKPHEARFCAARFFPGTKIRVSQGLAVVSLKNLIQLPNDIGLSVQATVRLFNGF